MFRVLITTIVCFVLAAIGNCQKQNPQAKRQPISGEYIGLEKMPNVSPDDPAAKWFHENTLLVRSDEAILDMVPVWIKGGKKFYSASDGGFLTYRAKFFQQDGKEVINLRLFQSDYIMIPVGKDPYKEIKTGVVKCQSGEIYIDGVRYRRKTLSESKRNNLLPLLDEEPLEKPAPR